MSTIEYNREISKDLTRQAKHFPALVLTGARQTGKTTLLRKLFPDHNYVSLDLPHDAQLAEEDPGQFLAQNPQPLLIDEVQYAPKLFRHLKVEIDKNRHSNGQFILTGSQKFSLMKEVSDSLAGRCAVNELDPLSYAELEGQFQDSLDQHGINWILERGFMPELWQDLEMSHTDFFRSYLATYLERDVRQILNIASLRDFDRFMRACAIRSGSIVNKSDIAKDVGVSAKTINEWLSVLEASNQISLLEPYFTNINKRLVKSPKLYFNDVGLLCFLLGLTRDSVGSSYLIGAIWETYVFNELKKSIKRLNPEASMWFYRDQSREVDFILERSSEPVLMDAKWKEYPIGKDFNKLEDTQSLFKHSAEDLMVICRAPKSFPVSSHRLAVSAFQLRTIFVPDGQRF